MTNSNNKEVLKFSHRSDGIENRKNLPFYSQPYKDSVTIDI